MAAAAAQLEPTQQNPKPAPQQKAENRNELAKVWFVRDITLSGSTMVKYIKSGDQGRRIYLGATHVIVEWTDHKGAKYVRGTPLHNVISWEPLVEA